MNGRSARRSARSARVLRRDILVDPEAVERLGALSGPAVALDGGFWRYGRSSARLRLRRMGLAETLALRRPYASNMWRLEAEVPETDSRPAASGWLPVFIPPTAERPGDPEVVRELFSAAARTEPRMALLLVLALPNFHAINVVDGSSRQT